MDSYADEGVLEESHVGMRADTLDEQDNDEAIIKWKISRFHKGAHILRKLFTLFIEEIVEGMIGCVHLPTIMSKLLSDNGSPEFGDFKITILGMLGTYCFERIILVFFADMCFSHWVLLYVSMLEIHSFLPFFCAYSRERFLSCTFSIANQ